MGRPLFKVTYTASLPEWRGKRNPYIQAFDILLDAKDLSLLKITSKWADNIDIKYQEGAKILRKEEIATLAQDDQIMISDVLPKELPQIRPMDMLKKGAGEHIAAKHIECYYITKERENIPDWFFITYGVIPSCPLLLPTATEMKPFAPLHVAIFCLINALTVNPIKSGEIDQS